MPRHEGYSPGVPSWIDHITPDLTGSQRFYAELFGWSFAAEGGYSMIHSGGEVIGGIAALPLGRESTATWSTYLATKDLDATLDAVPRLSGRVVMGPLPIGRDGRLALTLDPAGATIGFWEGYRAEGIVLVDEPGALSWHVLQTPDPAAAAEYYLSLFRDTLSIDDDGVIRGDRDERGEIVMADEPLWAPCFGTTDLAAQVGRATCLGALAHPNGDGVATGPTTLLTDPYGATFGLRQL